MPYLDESAERDSWRAPRGKPADPGRLWLSVKWDWRWIPLAGVIWGALGAGVAFGLIENTYRSSAALVWEPKSELRPDERELAAEVQAAIKAPAATGRARELLGLPIALTALGKLIDYQFEPHSRFVLLSTEGASPEDATKLAKVMVRVFTEQQRAFAQQRALGAVAQRERELGEAQKRVDEARTAYEEFRTKNGLSEEEIQQGLAQTAVPAAAGADGGVATAGSGAAAAGPPSHEASKLEALRGELRRLQAISKEHPRIASLSAQIAAVESRLAQQGPVGTSTLVAASPQGEGGPDGQHGQEGTAGKGGKNPGAKHSKLWKYLHTPPTGSGSRGSVRASELTLAEQRRRAEQVGQAVELRKQIEVQQGQLSGIELALARTRAQSTVAHEDWRVLTAPSKPSRPERGMQGLIAGAMPLTGMLVALLALLIRPLFDGRVYTAREAAYWGRLPVLASTAWPRTREMFFPLVDELGQQAIGAPGVTLVVAASAGEVKAAEELASWLDEGLVSSRRRGAGGDKAEASFVSPAAGQIGSGEPPGERKPGPGGSYPNGVHAWQGDIDGPQLRRAARVVDRVIVLVSSGEMSFSSLGELRTRLGRSSGVALVMLGLNPTLLKLPDQSGEVGRFWRYVRRASARA